MTTLYLIRHAEAEGNVFRRLQGQYDSMITPNGRKQIAALQARFAEIPVDAVYASDLRRTCITAGAVCAPKGLPLHTDPRLREISVGCWENQPFGLLERTDHEKMYAFSHAPQLWQVEGSEPYADYTRRFLQALDELARRHDGQTVAIFSHGMVLRGALQTLFFPEQEEAIGHGENTAVARLFWENGQYRLDYFNDASHLPLEISTLGRQLWWRGDGRRDYNMWYRDPTPTDRAFFDALGIALPRDVMQETSQEAFDKSAHGERVRISMLGNTPSGAVVLRRGRAYSRESHLAALGAQYGRKQPVRTAKPLGKDT